MTDSQKLPEAFYNLEERVKHAKIAWRRIFIRLVQLGVKKEKTRFAVEVADGGKHRVIFKAGDEIIKAAKGVYEHLEKNASWPAEFSIEDSSITTSEEEGISLLTRVLKGIVYKMEQRKSELLETRRILCSQIMEELGKLGRDYITESELLFDERIDRNIYILTIKITRAMGRGELETFSRTYRFSKSGSETIMDRVKDMVSLTKKITSKK